jgi:ribonuclease T2
MEKTYILFTILLCGILLITIAEGRSRRRNRNKGQQKRILGNSTDFDVLIFTQHWPPTVCYTWKKESESNTCFLPNDEEWTIHGIWPTKFHKIGPQFCNPSLPFESTALEPIEKQLEIKWVDIENGTKRYSFWKHEWQKHGTCSAILPALNTEIKYFSKGLDLLDEYDMKNILAQASIFPGSEYPVQAILNGVQKVLGKRCQVECVSSKKKKESYLFEIRICMDKSLKLVDCDGISGFPTNCPLKRNVKYPTNVPQEFSVIQI